MKVKCTILLPFTAQLAYRTLSLDNIAMSVPNKKPAISYRLKDANYCPICSTEFRYEMLLSGRGRLIVQSITDELRRTYKPNQKYGRVYPQAYSIMTCPKCLYSSFADDFSDLVDNEVHSMRNSKEQREGKIEKIFGGLSFYDDRNLVSGAASYLLALDCYQKRGNQIAPSPKKAICSLRGAWLCHDIDIMFPNYGFAKVREVLYARAAKYYMSTLKTIEIGKEPHEQFTKLLGPDTDKNWGFDGVIYMVSCLSYKYANTICPDQEERKQLILRARRNLSRIYGHGKVSKFRPSVIVNLAKELHEQMIRDYPPESEL